MKLLFFAVVLIALGSGSSSSGSGTSSSGSGSSSTKASGSIAWVPTTNWNSWTSQNGIKTQCSDGSAVVKSNVYSTCENFCKAGGLNCAQVFEEENDGCSSESKWTGAPKTYECMETVTGQSEDFLCYCVKGGYTTSLLGNNCYVKNKGVSTYPSSGYGYFNNQPYAVPVYVAGSTYGSVTSYSSPTSGNRYTSGSGYQAENTKYKATASGSSKASGSNGTSGSKAASGTSGSSGSKAASGSGSSGTKKASGSKGRLRRRLTTISSRYDCQRACYYSYGCNYYEYKDNFTSDECYLYQSVYSNSIATKSGSYFGTVTGTRCSSSSLYVVFAILLIGLIF